MHDTSTTQQQLQLVIRHWPDLAELATTRPHDAWPPTSLNAYLRTPEEYDPMDRSAPVRLHVLDTAAHIERQLVDTADHIAAEIQIPARSHVPPAARRPGTWTADYRARLDRAADQDAADPRRWRYTGTRTAPTAATWLLARLVSLPGGIFRPLTLGHRAAIERVAATAAEHIEHALGLVRRAVPIPGRPCACGGTLMLHGGDGQPPTVQCAACRRTWTPETVSAA